MKESIILLHGLGRTSRSMRVMAKALQKAGYTTFNLDYASRTQPIEALAMEAIPRGIRHSRKIGAKKIHFVTHSMGGILLRYYLSLHSMEIPGRAVMLSPPSQGSEVAEMLRKNRLYRWYHGPAGCQLGTSPDGIAAKLDAIDFPTGIITGNRHSFFDYWPAKMIPGENDGKVSVERAKAPGMADFLIMPCTHTFIMNTKPVIRQTLFFLRCGRFNR